MQAAGRRPGRTRHLSGRRCDGGVLRCITRDHKPFDTMKRQG
jgi:hypothetical protein